MRLLRRRPLVSVVVPAYGVEEWLPACLASLTAQTHGRWEAVVVDDASPDRSGEIAEQWAAKDRRIRVVHTRNAGLGAARNEGARHVRGDCLTFLDSDDLLPPRAYAVQVAALEASGSDFVTGSFVRHEHGNLVEPRWIRRLHRPQRQGIRIGDHPGILGDVFAWNKMFRLDFWRDAGLQWPEGVRYEDQPATTRAYLAGTFDVLPDVVYRWRRRHDGSAITDQRSSLRDIRDRLETKRASLRTVREHGDPVVEQLFVDRVLAGDLRHYFVEIPGCTHAWWSLLRDGVLELWSERSLALSGLPPVHRLCGWLVEQGRRDEAAALMEHLAANRGPLPRVRDGVTGQARLDVPDDVVDLASVDPAAVALGEHEA